MPRPTTTNAKNGPKAESIALEGRIRAVKDLKAETLEKILEAERQVMLWEKKTQLERETQVILVVESRRQGSW